MNEEILTTLYATVGGIVLGGIVKLGMLAKALLEVQTAKAQARVADMERDDVIYSLTRAASMASSVIERTYVKPLKTKGEWGPENAAQAKEKAVQLALELIGEARLADIQRVLKPNNIAELVGYYVEGAE